MSHEIIVAESQLGNSLAEGLRANLETLRKTHPNIATLLGGPNLLQKGLLARDGASRFGIIVGSGKEQRFLPLTDYQYIPELQVEIQPFFRQYSTIVFLGTGIGEFFSSALDFLVASEARENGPFRYIFIEPATVLLQAALGFCNFSSLWLSGNISFCIGSDWREQLDCLLREKSIANDMVLAIHPVANNRQIQLEVGKRLRQQTDKSVTIWQKTSKTCIAGPTGAAGIRRTFLENLEALEASDQLYCPAEIRNGLTDEQITFAVNPSGSIYVADEKQQKLNLTYREEELQLWKKNLEEKRSVYNTYLVLGAGDVDLLKYILEMTVFRGQWSGYEQVVYIVEPSVKLFVLMLYLMDISEYVRRKRLRMFVGHSAFADFTSYFQKDKYARIPNEFYACCYYEKGGALDKIRTFCEKIKTDLVVEGEEISSKLQSYYDSLPLSYWQERFNGEGKLTIAGITTRTTSFLQYCMRDLLNGFAQHGHQTFLLIEPDGTSSFSPTEIMRQLDSIRPDIIVLIDHLRDESPWFPKKVPLICWIQDMLPGLVAHRGYSLQWFDFTYLLDIGWQEELKKNPTFKGATLEKLPLACNEQVYHKNDGLGKVFDVSYITHLMNPSNTFLPFVGGSDGIALNPKEQLLVNHKHVSEGELRKIYLIILHKMNRMSLSELTVFVTSNSYQNKKKFLTSLFVRNSLRVDPALFDYLINETSRFVCHVLFLVKLIPVKILLENGFKVAVWGNNWKNISEFVSISHGVAENGEMINGIQNKSKICLNNSGGISFHMRALEILASGSFMLTRRIKNDGMPITDYLKEGEEVILFEDEQDLLKKTEYYLNNEEERENIAEKARKKTIGQYSYYSTAGRLISDIQNRIKLGIDNN